MKNKLIVAAIITGVVSIIMFSCTKEVAKLQGPDDNQMYQWSVQQAGRFYYQNDTTNLLNPLGGSPHGTFKLRFNSTAKNALGGDGKVPSGASLPDSTLFVKVMYTGSVITGYATIFKLNNAWFWGEYSDAGVVWQSVAASPSSCTGCHNASGNRDQTLVSTFH